MSVPEEKRAPAIFMTLTGEARETILNMDIEKLTEKTGANNLMAELDKMYLKPMLCFFAVIYSRRQFSHPHGERLLRLLED